MYNTLQFISHTANSFPSMEAVMQIYILSSHWTHCQHDLGNINATSKWKILVPTAKLLDMQQQKRDLVKMISSSVHSLPSRCTFMLPAITWFIIGLKRVKMLYRVASSMRNSLKDYLMETTNMMDRTTFFFFTFLIATGHFLNYKELIVSKMLVKAWLHQGQVLPDQPSGLLW